MLGWLYRGGRKAARWCKKLAFYLLPPFAYSAIKMLMPRVVQSPPARRELADSLSRRLDRSRRQHPGLATPERDGVPEAVAAECLMFLERYRDISQTSENNSSGLESRFRKAAHCYQTQLPDRARLLHELARLAALRGDELPACAYRVRTLRMLGTDSFGELPLVLRSMRSLRFDAEAEALAAMYEDPARAPERCRAIIDRALTDHRHPPAPVDFERFEDYRHASTPRVAVIVSMYKAADKVPLFLHSLRNQGLFRSNQAEIIFVDSGSPADEYGAITRTLADFSLPYLYVRTFERETIQTAWNRGIALARAPYLTFLGVDEAVTADGLEILADALDADPSVDWVQGDSLLTEVDDKGRWLRDIMIYDRDGYTRNHVYLETCYLSWVGAMYRRSIHERFGYYDGSFRATGDNEFKSRILPFIKTQRIPKMLGAFINYPELRATASPVAELEDIRAWYLHRTLAGVRYAMQDSDPCELEKLLLLSLRYRKSYTTHISSDMEYASHVATHLQERLPTSPLLALAPGIDRMLKAARAHDYLEPYNPSGFTSALAEARATWVTVQAEHRSGPWLKQVEYSLHRDNRYEQHAFLY